MKAISCSLALLLSACFCFAQDGAKQEPKKGGCCESEAKAAQDAKAQEKGGCCDTATKDACGALGLICPKEGKCEGECRKICDKVGVALKNIRTRIGELMQKEVGKKCDCTVGDCKTADCKSCETVKTKILFPVVKESVTARLKDLKTEVKHKVKADDGKESEVVCTFLTGDNCSVCVNTMADASWKKLKELFAASQKEGEKKCDGCPKETPKQ